MISLRIDEKYVFTELKIFVHTDGIDKVQNKKMWFWLDNFKNCWTSQGDILFRNIKETETLKFA